jgi:ferrous iron transport protein B
VRRILAHGRATGPRRSSDFTHRVDAWAMHPVWGLMPLGGSCCFWCSRRCFSWASLPTDAIKSGMAFRGRQRPTRSTLGCPHGPLRSLLVDGVIAGAGGVLVFLPQISDPVLLHPGAGGLGLPAPRGLFAGQR